MARTKARKSSRKARKPKKPKREGRKQGRKIKYDFAVSPQRYDAIGNLIQSAALTNPDDLTEGIHSMNWALSIAEQPNCPLLMLPTEIRDKIWLQVIFETDDPIFYAIKVRRHGVRFKNGYYSPVISTTIRLSRLSRQTYVDIAGRMLLYKNATLEFNDPATVTSYHSAINPTRRDAIRNIALRVVSDEEHLPIPRHVLETITTLKGLRSLDITFVIPLTYTDPVYPDVYRFILRGVKDTLLKRYMKIEWEILKRSSTKFSLRIQAEQYPQYSSTGIDVGDKRFSRFVANVRKRTGIEEGERKHVRPPPDTSTPSGRASQMFMDLIMSKIRTE